MSQNGTFEDLKVEVSQFKDSFSAALHDFEMECDQTLRSSEFRTLASVSVFNVVSESWKIIRNYPDAVNLCQAYYQGNRDISIVTYQSELKVVLENLFTNVIKHFQRTKFGTLFVRSSLEDGYLTLRIFDNVSEINSLKTVNAILKNPKSQNTLKRFVTPIVERLLQGYLWAEVEPEYNSVAMVLKIPQTIRPH